MKLRCKHQRSLPAFRMKLIARSVMYAVSDNSSGTIAGNGAERSNQPEHNSPFSSRTLLATECQGFAPLNPCERKNSLYGRSARTRTSGCNPSSCSSGEKPHSERNNHSGELAGIAKRSRASSSGRICVFPTNTAGTPISRRWSPIVFWVTSNGT